MTLLYSGGAGGLAMRRAFHELYDVEDAFARVEFSGRTDWSILHMALEQHGVLDGDSTGPKFATEMARFQARYYDVLAKTLVEQEGRIMPGVRELLKALSGRDEVRMGLETGNFRRSAFMKLDYFGLDGILSDGGFGDDAKERGKLVAVAIERVGAGAEFDPSEVWVIGDTPLDVAAAHTNGARALGVGTGPISADELREAGADLAMDDLSDTEAVVAALLE